MVVTWVGVIVWGADVDEAGVKMLTAGFTEEKGDIFKEPVGVDVGVIF